MTMVGRIRLLMNSKGNPSRYVFKQKTMQRKGTFPIVEKDNSGQNYFNIKTWDIRIGPTTNHEPRGPGELSCAAVLNRSHVSDSIHNSHSANWKRANQTKDKSINSVKIEFLPVQWRALSLHFKDSGAPGRPSGISRRPMRITDRYYVTSIDRKQEMIAGR